MKNLFLCSLLVFANSAAFAQSPGHPLPPLSSADMCDLRLENMPKDAINPDAITRAVEQLQGRLQQVRIKWYDLTPNNKNAGHAVVEARLQMIEAQIQELDATLKAQSEVK